MKLGVYITNKWQDFAPRDKYIFLISCRQKPLIKKKYKLKTDLNVKIALKIILMKTRKFNIVLFQGYHNCLFLRQMQNYDYRQPW